MAESVCIPRRALLQADGTCCGCQNPIFSGEIAYVSGTIIGCSPLCCHDGATVEADRSELLEYRVAFEEGQP